MNSERLNPRAPSFSPSILWSDSPWPVATDNQASKHDHRNMKTGKRAPSQGGIGHGIQHDSRKLHVATPGILGQPNLPQEIFPRDTPPQAFPQSSVKSELGQQDLQKEKIIINASSGETSRPSRPSNDLDKGTALTGTAEPSIKPDIFWSYEVKVPGSSPQKFMYPKAPVQIAGLWSAEEVSARFEIVQRHLSTLVYRNLPDIVSLGRKPVYTSCMVGTSPIDAQPSIVIWCLDKDYRDLRKVFHEKGEKALCLNSGSERHLFSAFIPRGRRDGHIPKFRLVYHRLHWNVSTFNQQAADATFDAYIGQGKSPCGSLIRHKDSIATLGPPILMRGETLFLTVSHVFPSKVDFESSEDKTRPSLRAEDSSPNQGDSDAPIVLWEDDDEYIDLDFDETRQADERSVQFAPLENSDNALEDFNNGEQWQRVLPEDETETDDPCMDWALARPLLGWSSTSDQSILGIKGLPTTDSQGRSILMGTFRHEQPAHLARVFMVSGRRGILFGQILAGWTYLPSVLHREYSAVWSIILDIPSGLIDGECGSVVIDEMSKEVYGHVVGSDPLGTAYVAPLRFVLEQIKVNFATVDVGLPTVKERVHQAMEADNAIEVWNVLRQGDLDLQTSNELLFWAARGGYTDILTWLLYKSGVDPDSTDGNGRTPLSWAAGSGHFDAIRLLLKTGKVDPFTKDREGKTSVSYAQAIKGGYEMIVDFWNTQNLEDPYDEPSRPWPNIRFHPHDVDLRYARRIHSYQHDHVEAAKEVISQVDEKLKSAERARRV